MKLPFPANVIGWLQTLPQAPTFEAMPQNLSPCPIWQLSEHLHLHLVSLAAAPYPLHLFAQLSDAFQANGAQIIHLWEDIWYTQTALVQARILALLGENERVYGRLTYTKRLDSEQTNSFLNQYHTQQATQARYKYGLFHKQTERLLAVASFTAPRTFRTEPSLYKSSELLRYASLPNVTVVGGLSKLLKTFVQEVNTQDIMTYADRDWSVGRSYKQLGFGQENNVAPQIFWVNPHTFERHAQTHLARAFAPETDLNAILQAKDWVRISNAGSLKFRILI